MYFSFTHFTLHNDEETRASGGYFNETFVSLSFQSRCYELNIANGCIDTRKVPVSMATNYTIDLHGIILEHI